MTERSTLPQRAMFLLFCGFAVCLCDSFSHPVASGGPLSLPPKKAAKETAKGNLFRGGFLWNPSPTAKGETARRFPPLDPPSRGTGTGVLHRTTVPGNIRGGLQWGAIGPPWPGGGVQGNLSEGFPGAPLVTFPASGKSRPWKGPQPCFSASRGSQSAAAGERPQALFIPPRPSGSAKWAGKEENGSTMRFALTDPLGAVKGIEGAY